ASGVCYSSEIPSRPHHYLKSPLRSVVLELKDAGIGVRSDHRASRGVHDFGTVRMRPHRHRRDRAQTSVEGIRLDLLAGEEVVSWRNLTEPLLKTARTTSLK